MNTTSSKNDDDVREAKRQALLSRLRQSELTRRALLRRCGVAAVAAGWAPSVFAASAGVPEASGVIHFMSWEGYDFPEQMAAWKQAHGVEVQATYMGSHDDIQAKILGGGGEGLDLITYGSSYKELYGSLKILTPIDETKIPNLKNLLPFFASNVQNIWVDADGTRTGVPADWGAIGISYDSAVVKEAPTSYDILFDPKYKGKVGMPDDPLGAYGQAARVLGLDSSKMTEDDFKTVTDWLKDLARQTKGISPSYGDVSTRFIAGDIVLSFMGWAAYKSFGAAAGKHTIETVWPQQGGGLSFSNAWAIPPGADNVDTVHAWINETLRPEVNAATATFLVGGVVVEGAAERLDPVIAALYPYDRLEEFFALAPLQQDPPLESDKYDTRQRVLAAWQEVKSAG
jgi:putative spermidine/putrescine transport system substrate-binding protein/spermidine/putrescine transport system substrate-binding protein